MRDLGILVFGHTRPLLLADTLESLKIQGVINLVDLWVDGDQGIVELKKKLAVTHQVGNRYDVGVRYYHRGQLGFRKLILLAMQRAVQKYRYIIFLEDDCFPVSDSIEVFLSEIKAIETKDNIFSVYGHPFLMGEESGFCSRFQGWGWGTTAEKLAPYLEKLINCYSMYEKDFLDFTCRSLTPEICAKIDITPPRLASHTLKNFFAWDETLCLLTALDGKVHKPTTKRIIYNCGIGKDASRFGSEERFFKPPFNMILPKDVWKHF